MTSRYPRGARAYTNIKAKTFSKTALNRRKEDLALIRAAERAEAAAMVRPINPGPLLGLMRKQAMTGGRGPEVKFVDIAATNLVFRGAGIPPTAVTLFVPVQGAAAFNRIGQKVTLKSLRIRGVVTNILTSLQGMGRIIVVYDKQANAALPTWTDLISNVSSAGAATNGAFDGINMANRDRFIILADEQIWTPSVTNTAGVLTNVGALNATDKNPSMYNFDRFIRLRDMESHFNNTNGGTFADLQSGSLSIFAVHSNTDSAWNIAFTARVRFSDM